MGNVLRKEMELQVIEMKRFEEELVDKNDQYMSFYKNYEGSEKERKKLMNEMIVVDEKILKLQGVCDEFLKEKEMSFSKVMFFNEVLEVIILSNEEIVVSLQNDLLLMKKEFFVVISVLDW